MWPWQQRMGISSKEEVKPKRWHFGVWCKRYKHRNSIQTSWRWQFSFFRCVTRSAPRCKCWNRRTVRQCTRIHACSQWWQLFSVSLWKGKDKGGCFYTLCSLLNKWQTLSTNFLRQKKRNYIYTKTRQNETYDSCKWSKWTTSVEGGRGGGTLVERVVQAQICDVGAGKQIWNQAAPFSPGHTERGALPCPRPKKY